MACRTAARALAARLRIEPLGVESQQVAIDLHAAGKWEADEIYLKPDGGEWKLCEGDPTTCPTPKLNVAESRFNELAAKGSAAQEAFKKADTNGDGQLSLDEFKAMKQHQGMRHGRGGKFRHRGQGARGGFGPKGGE